MGIVLSSKMATALSELIKDIEGKKTKSVADRLKKDGAKLVNQVLKAKGTSYSPLHAAVKTSSAALVDAVLAAGADVSIADGDGATPLHIACASKDGDAVAIIRALLKKKAKTEALNNNKETPWHIAAVCGSADAIHELATAPGAAGLDNSDCGRTPLTAAVLANQHAAVASLVQAGVKLSAQDASGVTSLMHLLAAGRLGDAQRLLENHDCNVNAVGTDTPAQGLTALLMVVPGANGVDINSPGAPALVTTLLDKGGSPDVQVPVTKDTPITWAVANKNATLALQLLKKAKQLGLRNAAGKTALDLAIASDQEDLVSALIAAGAEIDDPQKILKAALDGGKDILLAELIRACKQAQLQSAGISWQILAEKYPLGALAWIGKFERSKAADKQVDSDGNTLLHTLAESGAPYQLVLGLVKDLGMGVDTQNVNGDTALHVAAKAGHVEVCRALVDGGADVLKRNGKNRRPREVPKIPDCTRDFLMAAEESAKQRKADKNSELWDDKMKGTQTESACACGVL